MNTSKKMNCLTAGLAIFAMFFGAGNIIFPLALGQFALSETAWGMSGLLITAVGMPFAGLLAMFQCRGQVLKFFSRLGNIPGLCIACLTIALLGPFGAAPRCIALAHSTLSLSLPEIPLVLFSCVAGLLIFFFAYKENRLLRLLGSVLAPVKITLLTWIIIKGFMEASEPTLIAHNSDISYFWHGLTEGYNTMDLLAAFFFAPIIIASLGNSQSPGMNRFILTSSAIGAFLLAAVYIGFCYLAYFYASDLQGLPSDQLLAAIAIKVLGPNAGLVVSLTVAIACLTTAIALISAFASFMHKEVVAGKVAYTTILAGSLILTCAVTTLQFQGIAKLLNPVLELCYPVLILLTFYNLIVPLPQVNEN